jgi:hypothetical protein
MARARRPTRPDEWNRHIHGVTGKKPVKDIKTGSKVSIGHPGDYEFDDDDDSDDED